MIIPGSAAQVILRTDISGLGVDLPRQLDGEDLGMEGRSWPVFGSMTLVGIFLFHVSGLASCSATVFRAPVSSMAFFSSQCIHQRPIMKIRLPAAGPLAVVLSVALTTNRTLSGDIQGIGRQLSEHRVVALPGRRTRRRWRRLGQLDRCGDVGRASTERTAAVRLIV